MTMTTLALLTRGCRGALEYACAHQYLEPRNHIPKSRHWSENVSPNYDPARFRQTLRVSPEISWTTSNPSCLPGKPSAHQLPVEKQPQIALFRFGRFGDASL